MESIPDHMNLTVDQFPSVRPPPEDSNHSSSNNNICSSKQTSDETDRNKYQTSNRSTSLPSRQSFSSTFNNEENVKRRRYSSDSNNNNKNTTASLVTSFLQYLRSELRATTNDQKNNYKRIRKKKSCEALNCLSQTFNLPNNFYQQQYPIRMSSSTSSSQSSNENLLKNNLDENDENEISTLINLLILRVECLANENPLIKKKKKQKNYPTINQIDQNLIEYLYYLFNKFINDDPDENTPMIDKTNFVSVCQTLVRNGCFNISSPISPDQSMSESTITNNSDLTLTQTLLRELSSNTDEIPVGNPTTSTELPNDQDTWLVIDTESTKSPFTATTPDESKCSLQSSTCDDQLLVTNENYLSFEELKSCGSESSFSNYYSPNSSLVDLQNMVQEFDELNNNNNNNNNATLFIEDGSSSTDQSSNSPNVINGTKDTTTSNNNIDKRLTNDCIEQVASSIETKEQMTTNSNSKTSRREKKMQERWTISTKNDNEQVPTKTFLGVEFPPIAVLRKKFSSPSPPPPILNPLPLKKKDSSSIKAKVFLYKNETNNSSQDDIDKPTDQITLKPSNQEINTSITASEVDKTKRDQVVDLQSNDTSSSIICHDSKSNDDIQSLSVTESKLLTDEKDLTEDMTIKPTEEFISLPIECQNETMTIIDQYQPMNIDNNSCLMITDSCTSNLPSSSLLSISSSLITNTNEKETVELLVKEIEEEKKEEEHYDDDNVDEEEKNNCNAVQNYHASGTMLIHDEPTQALLLDQEKKEKEEEQETERPSSPLLLTLEQSNQQRPEDEPPVQSLSKNSEQTIMVEFNENEKLYKTVEIEEISDEEDVVLTQNKQLIEPTDCILTDDEPKISRQSNITNPNDPSLKCDTVLSCYEKALSKTVETIDDSIKLPHVPSKEHQIPLSSSSTTTTTTTKRSQRAEDDPIALRALERFEQRMNAAVAAKTGNDETNLLSNKGKSSWSGTLTSPRKSIENLFNPNQTLQSTPVSNGEETPISPRQHDTFIRPRKTMLDDLGLNFNMTMNVFGTVQNSSTDNDIQKSEEQHQPTAIVENDDKRVISDESTKVINNEGPQKQQEQQPMIITSSMTSESGLGNDVENSHSSTSPSVESTLNTVISHSSSSSDQQSLAPYRLQLEGRRRLNTLERIRERRQNYSTNEPTPQQQQLYQEYSIKPEELQDPIIRRALERFDEKSRSLSQAKLPTYDDIQDPITRRALMRLDTNLKRTMSQNPPLVMPSINNDPNETWYTNSYTLGSLQSNTDNRFLHYPESTLPPTVPHKPPHVSVHQRFCSTSSSSDTTTDLSPRNIIPNNENDIPVMRVPAQPIYVTSNTQPHQPINVRQRSRSEDMLSSRDLSIGQTTNLDDDIPSPLQRNHSSDDLQHEDTFITNESTLNETDIQLPNTIIKPPDSNFVRTTEASVNYTTPTQTYTGYSCEYTRPHQNQLVTSTKPELSSPRNSIQQQQHQQQQPQQENEIQYPTPSSSAFTPVHSSINNYYPQQQQQQPLPVPSYNQMYASNNPNQIPYSEDPIVRRALERFNSQMQSNFMNMPQQQQQQQQQPQQLPPNMNYMPRQYPNGYHRPDTFGSFYPTEPHQYDQWGNPHRSLPPTSNPNSGYQSIIGRRRQMRHDEIYHDIGNGYSTLMSTQNPYQMANPYMNFPDEPPVIPPRLHRDFYHEQPQEYLCENINNNNNNNSNPYMHHAYPATTNGFRPINQQYIPSDSFHQFQEEEYLRHRAQSTSSTTSSDSFNPIRLVHQRLPPTAIRTNIPQNNSQLPPGDITPNNGNTTGDSVFQRLAYTATKSSLSKSSSNLCANLSTKNPPQQPQQQAKPTNIKTQDIDDDDSTNIENNQESTSTNNTTKCQRSRSVDGRARLKSAQARMNNNNNQSRPTNDDDDNSSTVPSSKFTPINPRRDAPPPRIPTTPRSNASDRSSLTKRQPNGHNLTYARNGNGTRARNSNGNLLDTENDDNLTLNDSYQPKIFDNKPRTSIPLSRYATNNNNIQTSASTSCINNTINRTKLPVATAANLDRKESNASGTELNRSAKRFDDNRVVSPTGQRRAIPVSVFAPAKLENKRPAPPIPTSPTSPTNETVTSNISESQSDEQQLQTSPSSHSTIGDSSHSTINNENEINDKLSTTSSSLKSSTGNIMNELSLANDKHEHNKKMNVFERLFRGHKKKP